jgi:hypothetical protein
VGYKFNLPEAKMRWGGACWRGTNPRGSTQGAEHKFKLLES